MAQSTTQTLIGHSKLWLHHGKSHTHTHSVRRPSDPDFTAKPQAIIAIMYFVHFFFLVLLFQFRFGWPLVMPKNKKQFLFLLKTIIYDTKNATARRVQQLCVCVCVAQVLLYFIGRPSANSLRTSARVPICPQQHNSHTVCPGQRRVIGSYFYILVGMKKKQRKIKPKSTTHFLNMKFTSAMPCSVFRFNYIVHADQRPNVCRRQLGMQTSCRTAFVRMVCMLSGEPKAMPHRRQRQKQHFVPNAIAMRCITHRWPT